ncbi:MAG: membrane integrity-associated transporter subunit PqiC [Desulfobulbaceae bacterium]|nr:membrane integrity-associated transporter subunit PqiC [Desulfobulbaceae bacterium]
MTRHAQLRQIPAVCLVLALLLSSCFSRPAATTAYVLTPLPAEAVVAASPVDVPGLIMVMPVRLPPELRQKGIVVQETGSAPKTLIGHLWAGPLNEQISATLVANLQTLLGTANVAQYPGPRYSKPLFQVETEIIRFSGDSQRFTLRAVTTISDPKQRIILSRKTFTETLHLAEENHPAYVAAASKVLGSWSTDIATDLSSLMDKSAVRNTP